MRVRSLVAAVVLVALAMLTLRAAAQEGPGDGGIYRWNNGRWMQVEGFGTRISVGPDGTPWVVNSRNEIYRWMNGRFDKMPGLARDIGVGGDGRAWIIGTDGGVYRWNGNDWDRVEGEGVAISVDRSGAAWVVNNSNEIFQWNGDRFINRSGRARDIGAGNDVWLIGTDGQLYRRGPNEWTPLGGSGGLRVSAGANGTAWAINQSGEIYEWANGDFRRMPGTAVDIGTNAEGLVWMVGNAGGGNQRFRRQRNDR
jgi:hypothetical protein